MIRTRRLALRRARMSDLAPLHEMMRDAETMRYWSTPPHAGLEETRQFLAGMIAAPADQSDEFIITLAGQVIGKMGAWRRPEIGYLIGRPYWRRGFAAEALAAFIAHSFAKGEDCLTADVDPRNAASLALLDRFGFVETGRAAATWRVGDRWCDSIYLRLDRRHSVSR